MNRYIHPGNAQLKEPLIGFLKESNLPWEYEFKGNSNDFPDDYLIEWILKEGDLARVLSLFRIYSKEYIQSILNENLGDYYSSWRDFYNKFLFNDSTQYSGYS